MLNLDQVRLLENRVEKAIGKIQSLDAENARLRTQLSALQAHVGELEGLVQGFKDDQGRIEEGILNALNRLSAFEDSMFSGDAPAPATAKAEPAQDKTGRTGFGDDTDGTGMSDTPEFEDSPQERTTVPPVDGQMDIF